METARTSRVAFTFGMPKDCTALTRTRGKPAALAIGPPLGRCTPIWRFTLTWGINRWSKKGTAPPIPSRYLVIRMRRISAAGFWWR